jgi:protein SCO1
MSLASEIKGWRTAPWISWGILAVVAIVSAAAVFLALTLRQHQRTPPMYGQVSSFTLTNQLGKPVSLDDLQGQIWVANIIFTRCPGPCYQLTKQMHALQDVLPPDVPVRFVSLTADPAYDTPAVLNKYAVRFDADPNRWHFLTGAKEDIYQLAISSLKLSVHENVDGPSIAEQFLHTTRVVVVDGKGQLRDVSQEGTRPESVEHLRRTVQRLLKEKQ